MHKQIADRIICLRDIIPIQATSNNAQAKLDAGSTVHGVWWWDLFSLGVQRRHNRHGTRGNLGSDSLLTQYRIFTCV